MAHTYVMVDGFETIKRSDGAFIPIANDNADYKTFKQTVVGAGLWTQAQADLNNISSITSDSILVFPIPEIPLATLKEMAKRDIDATASNARSKYITSGIGQDAVYILKGADAQKFKDDSYPVANVSLYPFVYAEVQATEKTPQQATDDILSLRDAWISLAGNIEEQRIGGKKLVNDATDKIGVETAKNTAITALNAI